MAMLSIGELSRVTGLTIKTIRLSDEKGLLTPAVREDSGYRFYDATSVERARVIKQLRELEFSLVEIAQMLETGSDEADIVAFLERQQEVIANKLGGMQTSIEHGHRHQDGRQATMAASARSFSVEDKTVPAILVAGIRQRRVQRPSERFGKLDRAVGRHHRQAARAVFRREYRNRTPTGRLPDRGGRETASSCTARGVVHLARPQWPYAGSGAASARLQANQLSPRPQSREVCLRSG
jgi:DNA-binding transcriptional MerR regulator